MERLTICLFKDATLQCTVREYDCGSTFGLKHIYVLNIVDYGILAKWEFGSYISKNTLTNSSPACYSDRHCICSKSENDFSFVFNALPTYFSDPIN